MSSATRGPSWAVGVIVVLAGARVMKTVRAGRARGSPELVRAPAWIVTVLSVATDQ